MNINAITIFPEIFQALNYGLIGKAISKKLVNFKAHNLRDWASGVHKSVDDSPYGGGPGMIMKPEVWGKALDAVLDKDTVIVVPTPTAKRFTQQIAVELAKEQNLLFACGRYEGIDARVFPEVNQRNKVVEYSLGDYVIAGGESAALVMIEAIVRLVPGVLGNNNSVIEDSFYADNLLEGPQFTRPEIWRGLAVPEVLLSGNHQKIAEWKLAESIKLTKKLRPDLLD